jgi:uncharacterized protein YoxC
MAEYVTREEFEARVGVLEGEVEGEKLVTRYILEQTRQNGDDLASLKTRLGRVETRLDKVETGLESLNASFQAFVKSLPSMMRDVMLGVFQERDR